MARLGLPGCRPDPLLGYLKALGVLRILAEQADSNARGRWGADAFELHTRLSKLELVRFFLESYQPSPLIGCWNGSSGFYPPDQKSGIQAIENSTTPRLQIYREVIHTARDALRRLGLREKPSKSAKPSLLRLLRASLPDCAVQWVDAAYVLGLDDVSFPPLLGTGAIDGHLEFANNFMQRLCDVLPELGADRRESEAWLEAALFGRTDVPLMRASVGQFHPGGVGGPNATQGVEADSLVNPWDLVLGLEGTLLLAGGAARRYTVDTERGNPRPAFPFTVQASPVGYPTASPFEYEGNAVRAEIWLPVWHRPASYREVAQLLTEGRITWGGRQARTGADVVRAVVGLGVDRGVSEFRRFGFIKRSGRAYLAAPLGRYAVRTHEGGTLLADLDRSGWLERLRRAGSRERTPIAIRRALQAVEEAIVDYAGTPSEGERRQALQRLLASVWDAELAVARSRQFRESAQLAPFPGVSIRWVPHLDDGSPAFRLAKAIASIGCRPHEDRGKEEGHRGLGPLRLHLEPVDFDQAGRLVWRDGSPRVVAPQEALERRLLAILHRRVMESASQRLAHPDVDGVERCEVPDVDAYLTGRVDDRGLERLVGALCLVRWDQAKAASDEEDRGDGRIAPTSRVPSTLPWPYAVLKLLFLPWAITRGGRPCQSGAEGEPRDEPVALRPPIAALLRLMADDVSGAVRYALERLRAAGLDPPVPSPEDARAWRGMGARIGAALLVPVAEAESLWRRAGLPVEETELVEQEVARA